MAQIQKHFKKRDAILDYLRQSKAHPSAETIFTDLKPQIPDLAMGTVYRNLGIMVEQGDIGHVSVYGAPDRYDKSIMPHEHCICQVCGGVKDIDKGDLKACLEKLLGTAITSYDLTVRHICDKCKDC
jgi:Fe2+ or Zn2+ uptake regulation protein